MKYIIDFDHTLLDTECLKESTFRDARTHLVGTPEFWEHYCGTNFLFPDVLPWIELKEKEALHILTAFKPSQGPLAKDFQEAKLRSGNFSELVASVTVIEGMKGEVAASIAAQFPSDEPVVFIDDRLDQCLSVKEALPHCHCFLITRYNVCPSEFSDTITQVSSLAEVDAIMNTRL